MHDFKVSTQANSAKQATPVQLPYVDYLLAAFKTGNKDLEHSFGRHMHWGYWAYPKAALLTIEDFTQAAEELSRQVCLAGLVQNNQSILDVGCGFGGTIAHINEHYDQMKLIGVNLDERQLMRAREMAKPRQNNTLDFKQGNACALPLPDASFDVVLAVECIFHFPDREQFCKEAWRVLKPGGYLALSDFVAQPVIKPFAKIKLPETISVGFYGKCNLQYGISDYRRLANKIGFKIETERDITANTLPTYSYLRRIGSQYPISSVFAVTDTLAAELLSKTRLLMYYILWFSKTYRLVAGNSWAYPTTLYSLKRISVNIYPYEWVGGWEQAMNFYCHRQRLQTRLFQVGIVTTIIILTGCASTQEIKPPLPTQQSRLPLINYALSLEGAPYRYGKASPEEGFDCSGFVMHVYGKFGVFLPRTAAQMASLLPAVPQEDLQSGDLVFFNTNGRNFSHVGIFINDDRFIHAPSQRSGHVMISSLFNAYWRKHFMGIRRPATFH